MTLWLTRIEPDTRSARITRELGDADRLHRRIMEIFPDGMGEQARATGGILFRQDEVAGGRVNILVQSALKPTRPLQEPAYGEAHSRALDDLLDRLTAGQQVYYRIVANATRKLGHNTKQGRPNEIVPLQGAEAEEWWSRQAESSGLSLRIASSVSLDSLDCLRTHTKPGGRPAAQRVRYARTRFDGLAVVQNPEQLRERIRTGIGRGKSYGCGLLTVAPAR